MHHFPVREEYVMTYVITSHFSRIDFTVDQVLMSPVTFLSYAQSTTDVDGAITPINLLIVRLPFTPGFSNKYLAIFSSVKLYVSLSPSAIVLKYVSEGGTILVNFTLLWYKLGHHLLPLTLSHNYTGFDLLGILLPHTVPFLFSTFYLMPNYSCNIP